MVSSHRPVASRRGCSPSGIRLRLFESLPHTAPGGDKGAALIVSQFTLFADMSRGRRPSLLKAGDPARAEQLYETFVAQFRERGIETQTGSFGAVMRVGIKTDRPVPLVLSTHE